MACRYTYKGKTYEVSEFDDLLRAMAPDEASAFMTGVTSVPRAPYVQKTDSWLGLALRRITKMAVDEGYDRVAFVNGEQAASRFSLDKQVDSIEWRTIGTTTGKKVRSITINDKSSSSTRVGVRAADGVVVSGPSNMEGKTLDEVIGKDVAEKILADDSGKLEGDGLKIEAKGMRAFYDSIVPNAVKAMLKKVGGGQPTTVTIDTQGRPEEWTGLSEKRVYSGPVPTEMELFEKSKDNDLPASIQNQLYAVYHRVSVDGMDFATAMQQEGSISAARALGGDMIVLSEVLSSQPGFDITPAMRETASGGMPLFSDFGKEKQAFGREFIGTTVAKKTIKLSDLKTGTVKSDKMVAFLTRAVDDEYPIINAARESASPEGDRLKLAVEALPGRTAGANNVAKAEFVDPLVKAIGEASKRLKTLSPGQLVDAYGVYRLALHAPERNATLKANGSKKANPAGMSDVEAAQWMTFFNKEPDLLKELQSFDPLVKKIQAETDRIKLAAGLLTQDDIDARSGWANYINLAGDPGMADSGGSRAGGGWNNDIDPKAKGRDSLSANPVVNTVKVLENAVRLAEMARVKKAIYEFAQAHPAIIGAKVKRLVRRPAYDDNGNFLTTVPNAEKFATDAVVYRDGDKEYHIEIGDGKVLEAIKRLEKNDVGILLRGMGKLTSTLGRLYTQFSPHFPLVNFIRDLQQQIALIAGTDIKIGGRSISSAKAAYMIASRYPKTFGSAVSEVMGRAPTGKYTSYTRELVAAGGISGWTKMLNDEEALQDFVRQVEWKAGKAKTSLLWNKFVDTVSDISEVFELTTRVAAYSTMRDMGMPTEQAANLTKNLMNFSKAGTETRKLSNIFMFLKPSMTDVYRTSQILRSKKGAILLGSMYLGAVALYAMLRELSGDDDEDKGLKNMDTRTASERRSYFILPFGGIEPVRIPVGFGIPRLAWGLAVTTVDAARNPDFDTADTVDGVFKSASSSLSPMQISDINMFKEPAKFLTTTFSPTLLVPIVEHSQNMTKGGNTIYKANTNTNLPDYAKGFSSTPKEWKDAAQWMYDHSGQKIDVAPETLQYLLRSYGGGPMSLFLNALNSREKLRQGEELTRRDIPVVQAFTGPRDRYPEKKLQELGKAADEANAQIKDSMQRDGAVAEKIMTDKEKALVASMKKPIDKLQAEEGKALEEIRQLQIQDYEAGARATKDIERQSRAKKQQMMNEFNKAKGVR